MAMTSLSKRLRQLRTQVKELGVREFAQMLGKSPGYVSRIEGKGEIPSPELLCDIAEIFDVEPEELLELAKQSQLEKKERDIEMRYATALALYRKAKR